MPYLPKLNQRGMAPVAIVVAVVVVLAAAGGYYFMNQKGGVPSLPGVPGGLTLNPNCKHNDPNLCKFLNNWKDIKQFSVKSATSVKSGPKTEVSFEVAGEDKFHMMMSEGGKENWNVITMGDMMFTKDYSDNKWWKQKTAKDNEKLKDEFKFGKSDQPEVEDKTTYKAMGTESCTSMTCFKYQVINPDSQGDTEYIWFDNNQYLLRKQEVTSKDGSVTTSEFSYSNVNITEPSPTKDAKEGQVILPGGAVMPGLSESEKKELENAQKEGQNMMQQIQNYAPADDSGSEEGN